MRYFDSFEQVQLKHSWVAIGVFDGVHLGHQQIIRGLVEKAKRVSEPSVILTFHPHPLVVLHGCHTPIYLTTPQQRIDVLDRLGVDVVITQPFTYQLAQQSAQAFLLQLNQHLYMRQLWAGYDFALGKNREADVQVLSQMSATIGYTFQKIVPVELDGKVISSSGIRALLQNGDVEQAADWLRRPFQVDGLVISGDRRGSSIGIPTANVQCMSLMVMPKNGVYICEVEVEHQWYPTVTNIGFRPTFNGANAGEPVLEAHLLDFNQDIYGKNVRVNFLRRLREELIFSTAQDLLAQIQIDIQMTRLYFAKQTASKLYKCEVL